MSRTFFPTGQLTLEGSALVQADEVSIAVDNALALKATLANPNGTPVAGMRKAEFSWKMRVDNNGPEISMVKAVNDASPLPLEFRFPGGFSCTGQATAASATVTATLGTEVIVDCKAMGYIADSVGF